MSLDIQSMVGEATSSSNATALPLPPQIDMRERSAADGFITEEKPESKGSHCFVHTTKGGIQTAPQTEAVHSAAAEEYSKRAPVGDSVMHKSAPMQVSGAALYTDDIGTPANTIHGALVTSSKAHAKVINVDISDAKNCPGFVAYYSSKDVTGSNNIGAILKDEEVFTTGEVKYHGDVSIL